MASQQPPSPAPPKPSSGQAESRPRPRPRRRQRPSFGSRPCDKRVTRPSWAGSKGSDMTWTPEASRGPAQLEAPPGRGAGRVLPPRDSGSALLTSALPLWHRPRLTAVSLWGFFFQWINKSWGLREEPGGVVTNQMSLFPKARSRRAGPRWPGEIPGRSLPLGWRSHRGARWWHS